MKAIKVNSKHDLKLRVKFKPVNPDKSWQSISGSSDLVSDAEDIDSDDEVFNCAKNCSKNLERFDKANKTLVATKWACFLKLPLMQLIPRMTIYHRWTAWVPRSRIWRTREESPKAGNPSETVQLWTSKFNLLYFIFWWFWEIIHIETE